MSSLPTPQAQLTTEPLNGSGTISLWIFQVLEDMRVQHDLIAQQAPGHAVSAANMLYDAEAKAAELVSQGATVFTAAGQSVPAGQVRAHFLQRTPHHEQPQKLCQSHMLLNQSTKQHDVRWGGGGCGAGLTGRTCVLCSRTECVCWSGGGAVNTPLSVC